MGRCDCEPAAASGKETRLLTSLNHVNIPLISYIYDYNKICKEQNSVRTQRKRKRHQVALATAAAGTCTDRGQCAANCRPTGQEFQSTFIANAVNHVLESNLGLADSI
jgi:predicted aldo/keto reductase-like oxidoreductase